MDIVKSCILSIGNELLSGHTLDTNSHAAAKMLTELGTDVFKIMVCDDNFDRIYEVVTKCKSRILIVSGGLGATHDDITNKVINQLEKDFPYKKRNFSNKLGSAPGVILEDEKQLIFFLPGVPFEYLEMLHEVRNIIISEIKLPIKLRKSFMTLGQGELKLWEESKLMQKIPSEISVSSLPKSPGVEIIISTYESEENQKHFQKAIELIRENLSEYIFSEDGEELIEVVSTLLKKNKQTVAVAESCTGGLLGKIFTDASGSSGYFLGGIICYSNEAKEKIVGVRQETLEKYGAVSRETAEELAIKTRNLFNADFALSITGIAGPTGGSEEKPVGLVYIGCASKSGTIVKEFNFKVDRKMNRVFSATYALKTLHESLKQ
ncbi:MAG: nicotinamide-nucleotide amidohydrolase family protein [Nitrospinae bacterium]|nr:nicotinamide-nucleotide amidohydrolase family protein [Nitrospinota bacterium]